MTKLVPWRVKRSLTKSTNMSKELQPTDELLIGYRGFKLSFEQNRIMLKGSHGQTWEGPTLIAVCTTTNSASDAVEHIKDNECQCGIYSYEDKNSVQVGIGHDAQLSAQWECSLRRRQGDIGVIKELGAMARVVSWGYMVEGSMGWRSQYCRIEELTLYLPQPKCSSCGESYIPTTRNQGSEDIFWACDYTHGGKAQALLDRLYSELTGWYQCKVNVEYMNQRTVDEFNKN